MILIFHIIVAVSSMAWATITFFKPHQNKLFISYGLIGVTLGSGTYLVLSLQTNLIRVCLSGIFYTAIVSGMTFFAWRKLAEARIDSDQ